MTNIELVIKVPEEQYNMIRQSNKTAIAESASKEAMMYAIKNGTPLPKGHGRLIDADELYGDFIDGTEGYDCQIWNRIEIGDIIENAPTIIEADKGESEDKE